MMRASILVVDDEPEIRHSLQGVLEDEGLEVRTASTGAEALRSCEEDLPDLVLLDLRLPDLDGLEVLGRLKALYPGLPVVIISAYGTIDLAVQAVKGGAFDFIEKPFPSVDKVMLTVNHALRVSRLEQHNRMLRQGEVPELLGCSRAVQRIREQVELVAPTEASVLITGENGTGKELVARMIHYHSARREGPFLEVNCAAIPEELIESELFGHEKGAFTGASARRKGRFELADGGTLFLDEIGDMSPRIQAKVLRALEERRFTRVGGTRDIRVDVRLVAATNKDLSTEIRQGKFREDLFFRINVIPLHVPPLRERPEDVPLLVEHFLQRYCSESGRPLKEISPEAMEALQRYHWPGNVRELKNLMERLAIMVAHSKVELRDLPPEIQAPEVVSGRSLRAAREEFERRYILRCLEECGYNISQTAEVLGIERAHLYRKMRRLGIDWERA